MALFEQISEDIKSAMKARDKVALEALRNIKKVFLEAKTAPGANDTLEDADALKILQKLAKQGKESAQTFLANNRQDLADSELAQVEVIERYLPKKTKEKDGKCNQYRINGKSQDHGKIFAYDHPADRYRRGQKQYIRFVLPLFRKGSHRKKRCRNQHDQEHTTQSS